MSEYPDPDEEFELMYGDELELINQQEDSYVPIKKSRKSLDFSTPSSSKTQKENANPNVSQATTSFSRNKSFEAADDIIPAKSPAPEIITVAEAEILSIQSQTKKRSIHDLFGDIDDILYDDEPCFKKKKFTKEEADLELIERILELRKAAKEKNEISLNKRDYTTINRERDKRNLSFRVPNYSFIGVTRQDGERVYVRFHSEQYEKEEMDRIMMDTSFSGVMGDYFKDVWKEAQNLISQQTDSQPIQNSDISIVEPSIDESRQLWVDMYKPRKYLELLSDESTNRVMLRWIKLWDKVVFNRRPKVRVAKPEENSKKRFFKQELSTDLDEHGRPQYKVALLCGPPGLGKTTLAHMVAKHAGYNVVEVNASDDRSTDAFKTAIENATQMRSVVDQELRPNCLVFDEIDGAPASSIDFLVKFVTGTAPTAKPKKGKSGKKQSILKRPIICICNDVYVPALRPLRQISFLVKFPETSTPRLAERLMEISRRQLIQTDVGAMMALAEKSNNDIRSCLSILHFLKAQNKRVTLSQIYKANVGQKDMQKGLFSVWQDIFQIELPKRKGVDGHQNVINLKTRMAKILQTVGSFGDYERVAQGIFENYPTKNFKDSSMEGISQSLEWFCFSDVLNKQIYSLQNYSLSPYLQYAFVVWHFVFASPTWQAIQYPSKGYEAKVKKDRNTALVSEILRGMQPSVRAYSQRSSVILDVLPLLSRIIVPNLRNVSMHLYTTEEKNQLLRVINVMIDYNLSYVAERTTEGSNVYNLDPNIDQIVTFKNCSVSNRKNLSHFNKQLIAREIEMEKMRMAENCRSRTATATENKDGKNQESNKDGKEKVGIKDDKNYKKPTPKIFKVKVETAVTKDFFGRPIATSSTTGLTGPQLKNDILYKYKEGYNNAVRKKIKISSLL